MGLAVKVLVVILAIVIGLLYSGVLFPEAEPPKREDGWWGRGPKQPETDTSIREFKVSLPEKELKDLYNRLDHARFGQDLVDEKIPFQYGFPVEQMKKVVKYWRNTYDWRKQEAEINKFPQFKTTIEGIEIHFVRVKPKSGRKGKPLLIMHGWPGSVWEFYKMIPMLTDPASHGGRDEDAFEVIAPHIPGFGFSEAAHRSGLGVVQCAGIFVKLMKRLGHNKFYAQGGDFGSYVAQAISLVYPSFLYGIHQNLVTIDLLSDPRPFIYMMVASLAPNLILGEEQAGNLQSLADNFWFQIKEAGYLHFQASKPNTAGMGLNDSPIGIASYILEKIPAWTNPEWRKLPDGGLTKKFTMDDLLTHIMIYWISGSIADTQRWCKEFFLQLDKLEGVPIKVPAGVAVFPIEIVKVPRQVAEYKYRDIVHYSSQPRGGHFAALEEPRLLADDIFAFVKKLEKRDKIIYQ